MFWLFKIIILNGAKNLNQNILLLFISFQLANKLNYKKVSIKILMLTFKLLFDKLLANRK